ncbi:hypothetical protein PIROE2DRAFT_61162 [Piromyces sp. E2]|nr:hypothetical protein PIROE2DRAFT_61162 [Piromyces sp. E2]|eukprot:OUM63630.1 hypothetical protein PIROE2DRAFT_61162 [Piromyces sp. E2]
MFLEKIIMLLNDLEHICPHKNKNIVFNSNNNEMNSNTGSNIKDELKNIVQSLEKYFSLEQLYKLNKQLNEYNVNILKTDTNLYLNSQAVLNKMYEKPELIKFIKDKEIDNIHQLGEFIDDSEDYFISISDINQLENCMTFINELKYLYSNSSSDQEFLNRFTSIISMKKKYNDIGLKFENSAKKYSDFYELYTINLNPND